MNLPKPGNAALGRLYLSLLGAAFVILTALGIHGSSVAIWSAALNEEATSRALWYSVPRAIRADEWLVWTPSALAQARHQPPFPVENPALGAGRSPMLMNLPTNHYSTWFRPQLWGYFLFDFEHGFAWNWNVKIFGLLAAMFLLLRRLTGGSFWLGLFGSVWIFGSSFTQWWLSCPPMLPEMLASWALALWCVLGLVETPRWPRALALAVGLVVSVTNFSLSMYPPYQIPLVYLGLAVLGGALWQRSGEAGPPIRWRPVAGWLALCAGAIALVVVPFFIELLPTLHLVQNTSYPGSRRATGGALSLVSLFTGFAEPLFTYDLYPEKRDNICAASNFYPAWLAAGCWLLGTIGVTRSAGRRLLWPILICVVGIAIFTLCPLPPIVGQLTLLSFSTEERLILPVSFGGLLLAVLTMREMAVTPIPPSRRWTIYAASVGLALFILLDTASGSPKFCTAWRLVGISGFALLLYALYLGPARWGFAAVLLAAILPASLRVNPVNRGLAPLTQSTAIRAIEEIHRADPEARWLAFDDANQSALLMAAGVEVLSGAKTLPDLAFYREIDPIRRDLTIYNRYSLGIFHLAPTPDAVHFKLFNFCSHEVWIHPNHPALVSRQVRYFVFPHPEPHADKVGLTLFRELPEREMWIYRRKELVQAAE